MTTRWPPASARKECELTCNIETVGWVCAPRMIRAKSTGGCARLRRAGRKCIPCTRDLSGERYHGHGRGRLGGFIHAPSPCTLLRDYALTHLACRKCIPCARDLPGERCHGHGGGRLGGFTRPRSRLYVVERLRTHLPCALLCIVCSRASASTGDYTLIRFAHVREHHQAVHGFRASRPPVGVGRPSRPTSPPRRRWIRSTNQSRPRERAKHKLPGGRRHATPEARNASRSPRSLGPGPVLLNLSIYLDRMPRGP